MRTVNLKLEEVVKLVKTSYQDIPRAVFYIGGSYNVYPLNGRMFNRVVELYPESLLGVYDKKAKHCDIIQDLEMVA